MTKRLRDVCLRQGRSCSDLVNVRLRRTDSRAFFLSSGDGSVSELDTEFQYSTASMCWGAKCSLREGARLSGPKVWTRGIVARRTV